MLKVKKTALKETLKIIVSCLLLSLALPSRAEVISAYFEPFPPLITKRGEGVIATLFSRIEQVSDLQFDIQIATAHRMRTLIKHADADLIGFFALTPSGLKQIPTPVLPLALTFQAKNDIYSAKASNLEMSRFKSLQRVGVPYGNAKFVADLVGISDKQVYQQNMANLCQMLSAGRIDALAFERGAAMSCIQQYKLENIHYRLHPAQPVTIGILVQDTPKGRQLKNKLDRMISTINLDDELRSYNYFLSLPDSGIVPCCLR